ncbi:MAG TPA: SUMF1/EgtB/PvdO family nonheme iron enzyme, partial [Planctomycetota bacterium]|nr:SUMF1/EgtB/PvdO family nonheme iron enzyme [Planctomycetota bacterium]
DDVPEERTLRALPRQAPPPEPDPEPDPGPEPEERTLRAVSPPPVPPKKAAAKAAAAPAPAHAAAAPAKPAKTAKTGKTIGRWSVGTPVGALAIILFLGVGALYGFVWAGRLDWDLPPWARTLTGRDAIPRVDDETPFPPLKVVAARFNIEVPSEIAFPMEGEGTGALWGTWRIDRVLAPAAGAAAGGTAVFGRGALAGPPDASTGVIAIPLSLPEGKYRLHAQLRYGAIASDEIQVVDKGGIFIDSFHVERGRTVLVVSVRQEVGQVVVTRIPDGKETAKVVTPQMKAVTFGLPEDAGERALRFGDRVKVGVTAPGFDPWTRDEVLRGNPHEVIVDLKENAEGKVTLASEEIQRKGNPGQYASDAVVMGDPRIKVAMADVFFKKEAYADFDRTVEDLILTHRGKKLPAGGAGVMKSYAGWRLGEASRAAGAGDLETVRLQRIRCAQALDFLPEAEAAAERRKWAELEIKAWMDYPHPPSEDRAAPDPDRGQLERMVLEDLKLLPNDEKGADLRRRVAERILEHRAWPAWNAGNDLRPSRENEPRAIPGPSVRPWLELAAKAWPGIEDTLSYQRLAARLEPIDSNPRATICLLLNDKAWKPEMVLPIERVDQLYRKDRLLLARAMRRLGYERHDAQAAAEAQGLWGQSWTIYQRCFAKAVDARDEFPDPLLRAARFEAALVAELVKDKETALRAWDEFLALEPEDPVARRHRAALAPAEETRPSARMESLGYTTVSIPGGRYAVGLDPLPAPTEERPFRDNTIVPVNHLPRRTFLVEEFRIGIREVTVRQYRAYLEVMLKDPAQAKLFRHPDEPDDWEKQTGRMPPGLEQEKWGDDEPMRGVGWWDAWACARFLGGRLPTEAEWEKAALWAGRDGPSDFIERLRAWRDSLRDWPARWPTIANELSVFDVSPSGARGFVAGVAEWTMDPFVPRVPGARDGLSENRPEIPPPMPGKSAELMCVRGGSFFHRAPGEEPGDSPAEKLEPSPGTPPGGKGGAVEALKPQWRGCDLTERRGLPAGRVAKFVGFRVVIASPASERQR